MVNRENYPIGAVMEDLCALREKELGESFSPGFSWPEDLGWPRYTGPQRRKFLFLFRATLANVWFV
jgi:hypothetical protein